MTSAQQVNRNAVVSAANTAATMGQSSANDASSAATGAARSVTRVTPNAPTVSTLPNVSNFTNSTDTGNNDGNVAAVDNPSSSSSVNGGLANPGSANGGETDGRASGQGGGVPASTNGAGNTMRGSGNLPYYGNTAHPTNGAAPDNRITGGVHAGSGPNGRMPNPSKYNEGSSE